MSTRNEHTLAPIFSNARSGEAQRRYDEGYDRIFRKRTVAEPAADRTVAAGRARIRRGASIVQDRHYGKWPACCPPHSEYADGVYRYEAKDPDMVFDVEWNGRWWNCIADGYGRKGDYGNGSIFVNDFDGVELVHDVPTTA